MLDAWLKSKFYAKSNSTIRQTKTRMVMVKKKRNARQKYSKNDIADLLKTGLDVNAYSMAEGLLAELNISRCYDLLEQYCDHISNNLGIMYKQSKSTIRQTEARIEMVKKKRNAMQKYLKNDIADLLKIGLDVNAYSRAEGLLAELNISRCYDLLEQYCDHISNNLGIMYEQRECPEECREAVASLIFAAAKFADVPELRQLRSVFTERYGTFLEC